MQSHKAYAIGYILNSRVPKLTSSGSLGGKRQSDGERLKTLAQTKNTIIQIYNSS